MDRPRCDLFKDSGVPDEVNLPRAVEFVRSYRLVMADAYATLPGWLGGRAPRRLDEVFVYPRVVAVDRPGVRNPGGVLTFERLMSGGIPLCVQGPRGSGKSTWLRWTFRRLLEREDVLPVLLDLNVLAFDWPEEDAAKGTTLARYVDGWAERMGCVGIGDWLVHREGPRPVLMIDESDERIGLSGQIREAVLAFYRSLPSTRHTFLVDVCNRDERPKRPGRSGPGIGWNVYDLLPFGSGEIRRYAAAFGAGAGAEQDGDSATPLDLALRLGDETSSGEEAPRWERIRTAVGRSLERPAGSKDWRPEAHEARIEAVGSLAVELQDWAPGGWTGAVVAEATRLGSWLPRDWSEAQREGFLTWLTESAGLLVRHWNETLSFECVALQETLAALALAEQPSRWVIERAGSEWWQATIVTWADAVEQRTGKRALDRVLAELPAVRPGGLRVASEILSRGLGSDQALEAWAAALGQSLVIAYGPEQEICASHWRRTAAESRRARLGERLRTAAERTTWFGWCRLESWREDAGLGGRIDPPRDDRGAAAVVRAIERGPISEEEFAFGRVLVAAEPAWPRSSWEAALLQLWPGERRIVGARVQALSIAGLLNESNLRRALQVEREVDLSKSFSLHQLAALFRRRLPPWYSRAWPTGNHMYGIMRYLVKHFAAHWDRAIGWFELESAQDWGRYWMRDSARSWARDWALESARRWAPEHVEAAHPGGRPGQAEAKEWNRLAFGSTAARGRFACLEQHGHPAVTLLAEACRVSLRPDRDDRLLNEIFEQCRPRGDVDSLWLALARHLTRRSTPDDCRYLEELARRPERVETPLRWGLQYVVRGDVMLESGETVLLDDVLSEYGVPPLPYLAPMGEELGEVWRKESDWDLDAPLP